MDKESISLAALPEGHSGNIAALGENACTCKLLTLGLLPGARVTMVRKSPFGDAFYIKMEGYQLAVRKEEAMTIKIMAEKI